MISSKAKYALRAATVLAERHSEAGWMPTAAIAEREGIPRKFLEAILVSIARNGLIDSRRGSLGGHRLAREPLSISVADIIRIVDGPLALTPCASVTRFRLCVDCGDAERLPAAPFDAGGAGRGRGCPGEMLAQQPGRAGRRTGPVIRRPSRTRPDWPTAGSPRTPPPRAGMSASVEGTASRLRCWRQTLPVRRSAG